MKTKKQFMDDAILGSWDWPFQRYGWGGPELSCPHGVGHGHGVHGCDGCCSDARFKTAMARFKENEKRVATIPKRQLK